MIFSSADILRVLRSSAIIRLSAEIKVVDSKPSYRGEEGLFIYIQQYPQVDEFEASWKIWIESDGSEPDDIVMAELRQLLPRVTVKNGLLTELTVTEFRSEKTKTAPVKPVQSVVDEKAIVTKLEKKFEALAEDIQDRMLLVAPGKPGKDGKDGADGKDGVDGKDGKDGKDLVATEVKLEDLKNVEQGPAKKKGQVLTWDGKQWTNRFIPQLTGTFSAGGDNGGGTAPVSDAVSATVQWKYKAGPLTDPLEDGAFHTDVIEGGLVTKIRISSTTGRNNDITVLINDLLSQGYDRLYIAQTADLSQAQLYLITGYGPVTGGTELTVAHLQTAGIEPDYIGNANYEFYISQSAGAGTSGVLSVNTKTGNVVLDAADVGAATAAQGLLADTAVQPGDLATVATSGAYGDLTGAPTLGTAASTDAADYATAAQGALADSAVQPGDLSTVATSGDYGDLLNKPYIPASTTDLLDVSTETPVNGEVLTWNQATGKWEPVAPVTGGIADAPGDGEHYVRKNGVWAELAESSLAAESESKTMAYDGSGRLSTVTGATTLTTVTYNPDDTVATVTKVVGGVTVVKTFAYDGNGNLLSISIS